MQGEPNAAWDLDIMLAEIQSIGADNFEAVDISGWKSNANFNIDSGLVPGSVPAPPTTRAPSAPAPTTPAPSAAPPTTAAPNSPPPTAKPTNAGNVPTTAAPNAPPTTAAPNAPPTTAAPNASPTTVTPSTASVPTGAPTTGVTDSGSALEPLLALFALLALLL